MLRPNVHIVFCAWYNIWASIMYKVKTKKQKISVTCFISVLSGFSKQQLVNDRVHPTIKEAPAK